MEKPILLNTEEVKAILDGRKTMTRRAINAPALKQVRDPNKIYWKNDQVIFQWHGDTIGVIAIKPPYQPGDILWVRETWLKADDGYYYKADIKVPSESENLRKTYGYKWRPSIHMPREAARLFLRVKDVRVERLQDINRQGHHDDILKEGYPFSYKAGSPVSDFIFLWNSINTKRGNGWVVNPWVWVIEFERVDR